MDERRAEAELDESQSGLRDPLCATARMGAIVLILDALVLLLTIVSMRMMRIIDLVWAITTVLNLRALLVGEFFTGS